MESVWRMNTYVDGVILVRSLPTVSITRRPQTQRPIEIPMPPKNSNESGVSDCCITVPSL